MIMIGNPLHTLSYRGGQCCIYDSPPKSVGAYPVPIGLSAECSLDIVGLNHSHPNLKQHFCQGRDTSALLDSQAPNLALQFCE